MGEESPIPIESFLDSFRKMPLFEQLDELGYLVAFLIETGLRSESKLFIFYFTIIVTNGGGPPRRGIGRSVITSTGHETHSS